jgi:glycine cleavage system H protein
LVEGLARDDRGPDLAAHVDLELRALGGEVVFFDPPEVGSTVTAGESYAEVESVKAVSDVIAPLSGEIVEVNLALGASPDAINNDPYGEGWMVKVRLSDESEKDQLLDAAGYQSTLT